METREWKQMISRTRFLLYVQSALCAQITLTQLSLLSLTELIRVQSRIKRKQQENTNHFQMFLPTAVVGTHVFALERPLHVNPGYFIPTLKRMVALWLCVSSEPLVYKVLYI